MNPVAIRFLNQQLVAPQFDDPADVVGHLGAMQAQEYRLMRWTVEMRTCSIVCGNWSPFKEDCQVEFFEGDYGVEDVRDIWKKFKKFKQK